VNPSAVRRPVPIQECRPPRRPGKVSKIQALALYPGRTRVVTPDREIPWNELSRISDDEMKKLMKQIVNKLYTVLMSLENDEAMRLVFSRGRDYASHWDDPEFLPNFLKQFVPPDEDSMPLTTN
jgi:hypothetical protein